MARLLALLLLLPAWAAAEEPPDEAPARLNLRLPENRVACPSLKACCVPGVQPCYHPGLARGLLAGGSVAVAGTAFVAFQSFGDSLGFGDPYTSFGGASAIGLLGAGVGALVGLMAPRGEGFVVDRPGRPTLRLRLNPRGTSTQDEKRPYGLTLSADPSIELGEFLQLQPHVGVSFRLGRDADVDPRPQVVQAEPEGDAAFPLAMRSDRQKVTAGAELSIKLPYPTAKIGKARWTGPLEIRYRPMVEVRVRTLRAGADDEQRVAHTALYPATFGFRWHVSPRQRFTAYVGPRLDWIGYTDPGDSTLKTSPRPELGSFYAEAWYQIDIPFTPLDGTKHSVSGRFNLGYVHSNLDGSGINVSAAIGFFGPITASFDLRIRKRDMPVAVQLTAGIDLGASGGPFLEIGFVAPSIKAPTKEDS